MKKVHNLKVNAATMQHETRRRNQLNKEGYCEGEDEAVMHVGEAARILCEWSRECFNYLQREKPSFAYSSKDKDVLERESSWNKRSYSSNKEQEIKKVHSFKKRKNTSNNILYEDDNTDKEEEGIVRDKDLYTAIKRRRGGEGWSCSKVNGKGRRSTKMAKEMPRKKGRVNGDDGSMGREDGFERRRKNKSGAGKTRSLSNLLRETTQV
ncbi:hypothetical protein AXF42_Ash004138 [Apostasia shenzhenica]|uniref:Uncharacterized protein n=1 Tax=Apostasia shenzhenica TaxID=1088818 RepID=A0A2I0A227_9ASPA|nr:hypothetical protein AXF42_Ash004138 [Apostasia shenzhenica]